MTATYSKASICKGVVYIAIVFCLLMGTIIYPEWADHASRSYEFKLLPKLDSYKTISPTILVTVISKADNFEVRQTIRKTWANPNNSIAIQRNLVRIHFLLATNKNTTIMNKVQQESKAFGDIITTTIPEYYDNLVKKVQSALDFHTTYFPKAQFLMKIDDDVVVHIDRLMHFLGNGSDWENTIHCVDYKAHERAIRDPKSKWHVTVSEYPKSLFPTFCAGPLYLIGGNVVRKLLLRSLQSQLLVLEDVFYTGIVAEQLRIPRMKWENHYLLNGKTLTKSNVNCDVFGIPQIFAVHRAKTPKHIDDYYSLLNELSCKKNT